MLRTAFVVLGSIVVPVALHAQALNVPWSGYAHDPQHTAVSATAAQPLLNKHWQVPTDLNVTTGLIHYGSPIVTAANTVLLSTKTGGTDGFQISAYQNGNTTPIYTLTTDYTLPAHSWIPSYGPVLSLRNRMYYAGAGGTVYYRDAVDSAAGGGAPTGQIAFYGNALYTTPGNKAIFDSTVKISTPLTTDRYGDIFFGFVVTGANPANLVSGVARISLTGAGTWVSALALSGNDASITQAALNCTPALSNDQKTLYIAVSTGTEFGSGYLTSLNSTSLAPIAHVHLDDPRGGAADVSSDSSASPMVGPDGDVYYGVLENSLGNHNGRGWLLHFTAALGTNATTFPGSFGWDDTASVVASNLVPSYHGTSSYLILTKYNNYAGFGSGDGVNKLAVLDPHASQLDEYVAGSVTVMQEVITVAGITADPHEGFPNAVREWCINTAVIDPVTKSAYVNSEDGTMYRWDFTTNSLLQSVNLNGGTGEAYTPTAIGPDGTIYAINNGILYALGN